MSDTPIPDLTAALLGFRVWITGADGRLHSPFRSYVWKPGINEAQCLRSSWLRESHDGTVDAARLFCHHLSPSKGCHCGFNAWMHLADACPADKPIGADYTLGVIGGWGKVELHYPNMAARSREDAVGFRSSSAKVLALCRLADRTDHKIWEKERLAAMRYGVPLIEEASFFALGPGDFRGTE